MQVFFHLLTYAFLNILLYNVIIVSKIEAYLHSGLPFFCQFWWFKGGKKKETKKTQPCDKFSKWCREHITVCTASQHNFQVIQKVIKCHSNEAAQTELVMHKSKKGGQCPGIGILSKKFVWQNREHVWTLVLHARYFTKTIAQ